MIKALPLSNRSTDYRTLLLLLTLLFNIYFWFSKLTLSSILNWGQNHSIDYLTDILQNFTFVFSLSSWSYLNHLNLTYIFFAKALPDTVLLYEAYNYLFNYFYHSILHNVLLSPLFNLSFSKRTFSIACWHLSSSYIS